MDAHGRRRRRTRSLLFLDALAVGLALAGSVAIGSGRLGGRGSPPVRVSGDLPVPTSSAPGPVRETHGAGSVEIDAVPRATPFHLSIPSIGVDTPLVRLGLNPDGALQVPTDFSVAGWYALGPSAGERGAAVVVGHVDSTRGPAVFFRLGELHPGALVRVLLEGGAEVVFRVYAVREYAKAAFPTSQVYGATPGPELRLVTCGGPFDPRTRHYVDNVVVFARYAVQG